MSYDFFFPFCIYCTCHRYQYEHQIDGLGLQNINKPPRLKILIIWVEPAINGAESVFFVSHTQMCIKDMNKFVHDSLLKYTDGKKKEWIKQDIKWTVGCLKVWFWESSGNVQGCGGSWVGSCHLPISLQAKFYTCLFSGHKSRYAGMERTCHTSLQLDCQYILDPLPAPWRDSELCHSWAHSVSRVGGGRRLFIGLT